MENKTTFHSQNGVGASKAKVSSSWQSKSLFDRIEQDLLESSDVKSGLQYVSQNVCQYFESPVGQVWQLIGDRLQFLNAWHKPDPSCSTFVEENRKVEFGRGQGLPGQVWASESPVWNSELIGDTGCPRQQMAAKSEMRGAFAFPLFARGRLWGVMEFFTRKLEEPNNELMNTFVALSSRVSLFVERQESGQLLRESEARHRELLEGTSDLIMTIAGDGSILYVNRAWQDCLGYDDVEVRTLNIRDTIHCGCTGDSRRAFERALAGERIERIECKFISKSGETIHTEGFLSCSAGNGSTRQVHGMFRDVTARVRAEEELRHAKESAEAANRAKSDFLAVMSHEIRTPLNAILGLTSLMQGPNLDFKQRMFIETSLRSGEALLLLINDILDISKIESGENLQLEANEFRLSAVIESVVRLLKPRAEAVDISLIAEIDPEIPSFLVGDASRLRQVLVNLVGNAIKFTEQGDITIRARQLSHEDNKSTLRIEVQDTGVGINSSDIERVFEPFTQADSSSSRRRGGTGLGLAICKRIIALMGGTIGVESEPERGSLFWFELTMPKGENNGVSATTAHKSEAVEIFNTATSMTAKIEPTLRILAAEDTETNRLLLRFMLDGLGQRADYVENGVEAINAWSREKYDVILMDCQMPTMNGFDATREIRRRETEAGVAEKDRIRIIALTANALKGDREACLAAGMNAYLSKPYAIQQLHDVLVPVTSSHQEPPAPILPQVAANEPTARLRPQIVAKALDFGATRPGQLLAGLGEEATSSIAEDFLQDLPVTISRIRELAKAGELKDLAMAAHSLRGIGASLGMKRLVMQCQEMEDAANEGGIDHVRELAATIQETAEAGAKALRRWIAAQRSSRTSLAS